MMLKPDVRACIGLYLLLLYVTPVIHIPEHLSSTGTLVITWRHFFFCPKVIGFSVRKLTGKIITDISDWTAALLLNINHYKTTAVVEHLYCTILHSYTNKVLTKVHIYRVLKRSRKMQNPRKASHIKAKRKNVLAD